MILNKLVIRLIKITNPLLDLVYWFMGLFGIRPIAEDKHWYYKGVCLNGRRKGIVEQIAKFDVRDDDIFVATFSRSGTHLTAELVDCILDGGDTSRLLSVHQESRSPLIDLGHPYCFIFQLKYLLSAVGLLQKGAKNISGYYKSWKSPRVFKTHLPVQFIPQKILEGKGKLIYVARNPMDTIVSNWKLIRLFTFKHYASFHSYEEYFEAFLSGDVPNGSWFDHIVGFWKRREQKNILFLKFEDIKGDMRGTIRRLAEFLERGPLSDETVEKVADHCSLKRMKENVMISPGEFFPSSVMEMPAEGGFFRKGVVGGWRTEITEEQAEKIKEKYREKVASQGLHLKFE